MKIKSLFLSCLIMGISFITFSQTRISPKFNDYKKDYHKADSLRGEGLPKSALLVVGFIYMDAKNTGNIPQMIRSFIYKLSLWADFEDDYAEKAIAEIQKEMKTAKPPMKQFLHSMLAQLYWGYYEYHRYEYLGRTQTVNFKEDDLKTWDLTIFVERTIFHYQQSLKDADILKKTEINLYDAVLVKDTTKQSQKFRPTLYDLLAHRAIDFFCNSETQLTKPVYAFEIDRNDYFADVNDFIKLAITTKDSLSFEYYALELMQDLLKFHAGDANPQALIDADLKRLIFIHNKSVSEFNDSLYTASLENMLKKYQGSSASADIAYELGKEYISQAGKYKPLMSDDFKWRLKDAYKVCEDASTRYPKTIGGHNCKCLLQDIETKYLNLTTEMVNPPDKPFRAFIKYKNTPQIYFRIIKIDAKEDNQWREKYQNDELVEKYVKQKTVKEWNIKMPDDRDYQEHSAEVKIPELPFGFYIILASADKNFNLKENYITYTRQWISELSYINRVNKIGGIDFYVLNRTDGSPVEGVDVQTYYKYYDYNSRKYVTAKYKEFKTDFNGYFEIPAINGTTYESKSFSCEFSKYDDLLITDNYFYQYNYSAPDTSYKPKTFFFTDRAIYRPGQTVYFKAIVLESNGKNTVIKPNTTTTVSLYNVNYQIVSELKLVTNEYGTVSGSFTAPANGLTGQMYLTNGSGYVYFSVEEYKRPKFEVEFEPVKGTYKLNETVNVVGTAKAFAGNNIDGASVKYRVVRNVKYSYYWGYSFADYSITPDMEIMNGTTTTNEKGEFKIDFKAIPDRLMPRKLNPEFLYTIYADVTDINGETHSSETYVSVGYISLLASVDIPTSIDKDKEEKYNISTTNLNGVKENASGEIHIWQLKQPDRIFRSRYWATSDKFTMTKEEYYALFPNDPYKEEDNIQNWDKVKEVLTFSFNTEKDSILILKGLRGWDKGDYLLIINTKDKYGAPVESKKYFSVYDPKSKEVSDNSVAWSKLIKGNCEPGEKASVLLGTKEKELKVLYEIENDNNIIKKEWLTLSNEQRVIEIPVTESLRGNFNIYFTFVKNNRSTVIYNTVTVPYTNKQLDVEFESFRNKLLPGQQEEWKIKIKDKKGDKMAAEMVATLYDASLDEFKVNNWYFNVLNYKYSGMYWNTYYNFTSVSCEYYFDAKEQLSEEYRIYDELDWIGFPLFSYGWGYGSGGGSGPGEGYHMMKGRTRMETAMDGAVAEESEKAPAPPADKDKNGKESGGKNNQNNREDKNGEIIKDPTSPITDRSEATGSEKPVQIRKNFNETAFFYPQLQTNEKGEIIIKFTVPEALTKWKMMGLAHTKDLKTGMVQKELVTQKDLMVMPNAPRFFREGDTIYFSAKISNISDKDLFGESSLELFDATTMKSVDELLNNKTKTQKFDVIKGQSTSLNWKIFIPQGIDAVTYRLTAKSGNFSDGEEMAIPVLSNRMMVTESLPLPVNGKQTKQFKFDKLLNSGSSTTLRNYKLTLEFSSNSAWYAVQALPYLMEYPYECSEQTFNRYYACSLASYIANSNAKIKKVFDSWKNFTPDALLSNLEKNQELKNLILEETPWVLQAKSETERKQRIALLFNLDNMSNEMQKALDKLIKKQTSNGGFAWFDGMPDDRYITQYIVTGFGHLDHIGVIKCKENQPIWNMLYKAITYLDERTKEDYEYIKKHYASDMDKNHLGYYNIQYLYARSYFMDKLEISSSNKEAFKYFIDQAEKYWTTVNNYQKGMIALALYRNKNTVVPVKIINSLKETALHSEEMGMYWRDMVGGYYWYEAPIETQSLLIECFDEVASDKQSVEELKIWLLKQKQTQDWKTTKATAEACYALLLKGSDNLASDKMVEITMGNLKIDPAKMDGVKVEAGTGYFKTSWNGSDIKPEFGNIKVKKSDDGVAWGAIYWQYFEQLDKITSAETPIKIEKKLFVEKNSPTGPIIDPVTDKSVLKIGDKIKVRIVIKVDRDMEYVHMKDMRASGFEPVNVLSQYKYQDGLGYYESTKDAATNFFFSYLPKGTYVFEYPMFITHKGDFSNGITSIQCMYAPEFSSHSEGIRVKVVE